MESNVPLIFYGTAWKEDDTAKFTETTLKNGFTAVDGANYPTAYNEPLTGAGIAAAIKSGIKRSDLFIQTKFTTAWAHEKGKIPFDPDRSVEDNVRESVRQSLEHLQVDYLDVLLIHILFEDDTDNSVAWRVLETFVPHLKRV